VPRAVWNADIEFDDRVTGRRPMIASPGGDVPAMPLAPGGNPGRW